MKLRDLILQDRAKAAREEAEREERRVHARRSNRRTHRPTRTARSSRTAPQTTPEAQLRAKHERNLQTIYSLGLDEEELADALDTERYRFMREVHDLIT